MKLLNLTIDLPASQYTITDGPAAAQRLTAAMLTVFSSLILIFATVGISTVYAVNTTGQIIESVINLFCVAWSLFDTGMLALFGTVASVAISAVRFYAA